jgi:hypothetical protein
MTRPCFYVAKSDRVKAVIALAFSLLVEHEYLHDAAGYILGIYCMTVGIRLTLHTRSPLII